MTREEGLIVLGANDTAPAFHSEVPNIPVEPMGIDNNCPLQSPLLNLA